MRRGPLRIHEESKNLTVAEKIEYWQRRIEEMLDRQQIVKEQQQKRSASA
jgi:hypothetical protein